MLKVYHGATCIVRRPLCNAGRPNLDFGRGFYVTDLREQAVSWAERQSAGRGLESLLNVYELDIIGFVLLIVVFVLKPMMKHGLIL